MKRCLPLIGLCVWLLSTGRLKAQGTYTDSVLLYSTENPTAIASHPPDAAYTIREIQITGNKRTRNAIILRELPFALNESYPLAEIIEKLQLGKRQLMNTNLFRTVAVSLKSQQEKDVTISVEVEERWYLYPRPFIGLGNGNLAQWNENGRKLHHLNYGIKFTQYNLTGRNDKMSLNFTDGYTKKVAIQYLGLILDRSLKWTAGFSVGYGKNHEINYATENNKRLAIRNPDGYLYQFFYSSIDLNYRPAIKTRHTFSFGYNRDRIADTVSKLNQLYSSRNTYSFPHFTYTLSFLDLDFIPYPTRGQSGEVSIHRAGINSPINLWQLSTKGTRFWPLGKKGFFNLIASGTIKLPFQQPYIMQQLLGVGSATLQGYENYVMDGVAGGYVKASVARNMLSTQFDLPTNKYFKSLRTVPLKVYAKAFVNSGYAHNPNTTLQNALTNRMLYSAGVGLDIIAFTDLVIKLEWSFNQLGQNGLYLHQSSIY